MNPQSFKKIFLLCLVMLASIQQLLAFNTNSAYISLYSQKTEIIIKNNVPSTRTKYEIVFKFNDEKAITLHHNYAVYYSYFDQLEHIEAYTKNPQPNGKIKTIDIKDLTPNNSSSNGIFYDDQKEININFLGLTIGSEAHVEYTISTNEMHFTDPMIFRYYLPIEKEIYELTVPEEVHISLIEKNVPPGFIQSTKEVKRNETIYTWTAHDVDEEKHFEDAPARTYYTPHIIYKIEDFTIKGKTINVSKSPADLFEWYVSNIKQIGREPSEKLRAMADSITKGSITETEKVKRIFDWVKNNIRYVAFENGMEGLVPRQPEVVCSKRYGDCKDMSSLQIGLLRSLNIPAYFTWIGTRRIPYTYSEVPMKNTDNHMIAAIKDHGKWVFLDATDPSGIYGLPSDHIQGKQALIYIDDTKYELVDVPVVDNKTNMTADTYQISIQNKDIEIHSSTDFKGMMAGSVANQLRYMSEKDKEDFAKGIVKSVSNNAILNSHKFPVIVDESNTSIGLNYSVKDYLKEADNEKYINIFLNKILMNDAVREVDRNAPVSFKYNMTDESTYILSIPEHYKVSFVPENSAYKNDHFEYRIEYKQENSQLICHQKLLTNFPNLLLQPDEFKQWNQFIKGLNNAYKESIILEKIK